MRSSKSTRTVFKQSHADVRSPVLAQQAAIAAPGISGEAAGSSAVAVAGGNDQAAPGAGVMFPYPVSTNRYWRKFKGRMVVSAEANQYKAVIALIWQNARLPLILSGPVHVLLTMHPKMTKQGKASNTRMDIDNMLKVLLDGLNGLAWTDDKQVHKLSAEIAHPVEGGGVSVQVMAHDPR